MTAPQPPFTPTGSTSPLQTPTPATEPSPSQPHPSGPAFGAPSTPPESSSGPMFGVSSSPPESSSGPMFGVPSSPPQPSAPMFGAPSQPQPSAPMFGAPSQPQFSTPVVGSALLSARRGSVAVKLVSIVVVALAAIVGGVVLSKDEPRRAKIGDCLAGQAASEIEIVKCGDPKALYRVVGKIDSISQADWDSRENACSDYPTAESSFWEGKKGAVGYALCLETVAQ